jgi:hypothetical protein
LFRDEAEGYTRTSTDPKQVGSEAHILGTTTVTDVPPPTDDTPTINARLLPNMTTTSEAAETRVKVSEAINIDAWKPPDARPLEGERDKTLAVWINTPDASTTNRSMGMDRREKFAAQDKLVRPKNRGVDVKSIWVNTSTSVSLDAAIDW